MPRGWSKREDSSLRLPCHGKIPHKEGTIRLSPIQSLDELEAYPDSGKPILHWFSGNYQELKRAIDIGCWFSVGPAMLRSKKGKEITSRIPRDKILTESDGPFAKLNNKPLTPMDMPKAIEILAQLWGESIKVVNERLLNSFRNLLAD